ncbi:MAG: beta-propeller domain-containing protein [archaeon]
MKKQYIFAFMILTLLFAACKEIPKQTENPAISVELQGTDELKKFSTRAELMDFLDSIETSDSVNYGFGGGRGMMETATMDKAAAPQAAMIESSDASATDYSTTNVQVEGVDEADFVKNDGKYIYMIVENNLVIVNAYPAEDADIVSETDIEGYPRELFLSGDTIVVFTQADDQVYAFPEYDIIPRPIYKTVTKALVYDVSDREDPKLQHEFDLKGSYVTSRMIGDYAYIVAQDNVYYSNHFIDMPTVRESSKVILMPDVYYFDNPEYSYNFNTVMSLNLKNGDVDAKTFMMGYSNTIFVSEDNMYITYQKNLPYRYYNENSAERFYEVVLPLLPSDVSGKINEIKSSSDNEYLKWDKISAEIEEMYNNMDEDEKDVLMEKSNEAVQEYEIRMEEERRKTIIHKINIDNGKITYDKRGEVKGYLLNQFSLDEFEGNLRVATTFDTWTQKGSVQYNNVYVLDSNMEISGKLEKIAPDERIYSTRFMGDRLYMVTFKRMDPLFVIDLSNSQKPKILGELKIPGFSDYLHPYDENHLIGVGKDTGENEWGGISTKGVKIALFDVTDVENPKQVDQVVIGTQGTDSEALYDHKAFLFDKKKNLLVIPIREVRSQRKYDPRYGYYTSDIWQGAYVFTITDSSLAKKGKITHAETWEDSYYSNELSVRRSLFMDDVLYTISLGKIKMNDLGTLDEIGEVDLPYEGYRYQPYYRGGPEMMVDDVMME